MLTTPEEKINACIHWAEGEKAKCDNEEGSQVGRYYYDGYLKGARMVAKMLKLEVDGVEKY